MMDRRSEPRLPTETPVRVQALRDGTVEFTGVIVNTSGRGLRVHLADSLNVNEVVRLITDSHHAIAIVRYCQSAEGQFAAGIERTDEWLVNTGVASLPDLSAVPPQPAAHAQPLKTTFGDVRTAALRELFDAPQPPQPPRRSKRPLVVAASLGVLGLAAALGVTLFGPDSRLEQTAEAHAPAAPPTAADPAPQSPQATATRTVRIEIRGDGRILACADGAQVFDKLFHAGDRAELHYSAEALLRAADAAMVDVALGAEPPGPMGPSSGERAWAFTGDTHREIPAATIRGCAGL